MWQASLTRDSICKPIQHPKCQIPHQHALSPLPLTYTSPPICISPSPPPPPPPSLETPHQFQRQTSDIRHQTSEPPTLQRYPIPYLTHMSHIQSISVPQHAPTLMSKIQPYSAVLDTHHSTYPPAISAVLTLLWTCATYCCFQLLYHVRRVCGMGC